MKISSKIDFDRSTIELTREDNKYYLWIYNKTIDEHVSITLSPEELNEVRKILCKDESC